VGRLEVVFSSRETLKRKRRELRAEMRALPVAACRSLLESFFSVLFPSDCRLCSAPLANVSRVPVCPECLAAIRPTRAPQCVLCGDRLSGAQLVTGGTGVCPACQEHPPQFDRALSFAEYRDHLKGLIHLLKYERVTPVAGRLGACVAQVVAELLASAEQMPLVVPVSLHRNRRRSRGFNQAELIARATVKRSPGSLEIAPGLLVRERDTISQVGLTRAERIENMWDAFRVPDEKRVAGRDVVLIDDVMTTGTTLSECARVLKLAGAHRVWAATAARAYHGAEPDEPDEQQQEEIAAAEVVASV